LASASSAQLAHAYPFTDDMADRIYRIGSCGEN